MNKDPECNCVKVPAEVAQYLEIREAAAAAMGEIVSHYASIARPICDRVWSELTDEVKAELDEDGFAILVTRMIQRMTGDFVSPEQVLGLCPADAFKH